MSRFRTVVLVGLFSALVVPSTAPAGPTGARGCVADPAGAVALVPGCPAAATTLADAAGASTAASASVACAIPGDAACERWTAAQHSTPFDTVRAMASDPGGTRVFMTGIEWPSPSKDNDIVTMAFDTDGRLLWEDTYDGPRGIQDYPYAVTVSPDGATVVVAGAQDDNGIGATPSFVDYVAIAFDAATGERQWVATYDSGRYDFGIEARFAPDGSRLYMTGISRGIGAKANDYDHVTVAFDGATGALLWSSRQGAPNEGYDYSLALSVSGDGRWVASTGWWQTTVEEYGIGTHVYDAETGALHLRAVQGAGPKTSSSGWDVEFSPDSGLLHVAGAFRTSLAQTTTYRVADGALLWTAGMPHCQTCSRPQLAVSPATGSVYTSAALLRVVGQLQSLDFVVAHHDPVTGEEKWVAYYDEGSGLLNQYMPSLAIGGDGARLYLAGSTQIHNRIELTTVALDAATGALVWDARYGLPSTANIIDPSMPSVSAAGERVFVAQSTIARAPVHEADFFVAAYDA